MTIDEMKKALVEVKDFCAERSKTLKHSCDECPFVGKFCLIDNCPEFWGVDRWRGKEPVPQRTCTSCGKTMTSGYVIGDGEEYFCSDECLGFYYSESEYNELYKQGDAYWTEWEE